MEERKNHGRGKRPRPGGGARRQIVDRARLVKGASARYVQAAAEVNEWGTGVEALAHAVQLYPGDLARQKNEFFALYRPRAQTGGDRQNSFASVDAMKGRLDLWLRVLKEHCNVRIRNLSELSVKNGKLALLGMEARTPHYSGSYLQNTWTLINRFLKWQAKGPLPALKKILKDPNRAKRSYSRTEDQSLTSAGVDLDEVAEDFTSRGFEPEWMLLKVSEHFGLRRRELVHLFGENKDKGDVLEIRKGSKGGRPRDIPIETPEQRAVLDKAKELAHREGRGVLTSSTVRRPTETQRVRRFKKACEVVGFTMKSIGAVPYSCRRQFAGALFQRVSGEPTPVRGGKELPREEARLVKRRVAEDLGHSDERKAAAYFGTVRHIRRVRRQRLETMEKQVGVIGEQLRAAGFRMLRVIGPAAEGKPPQGPVCVAWEGEGVEPNDPVIVESLSQALAAPVILVPMNSPAVGSQPTFEVL